MVWIIQFESRANRAHIPSLRNSTLCLELRAHQGVAWHLSGALSGLLASNSSYCSLLYNKRRPNCLSQNSSVTENSKFRFSCTKALPYASLRLACLQPFPLRPVLQHRMTCLLLLDPAQKFGSQFLCLPTPISFLSKHPYFLSLFS